MPSHIKEVIEYTTGRTDPCPACGCWGLRDYTAEDGTHMVVCMNTRCHDPEYKPVDFPYYPTAD
jgi:hypothetical protein